ncbi:MAG: ABC transporter permease [Pirellulales bacterium]|nr:ABC transporter permease [Pirellulales bacterium]
MYKFLLCWRYLRTRYIALASIISVMLGVATMIVVNSVMSGFVSEMYNRLHGIFSDVVIESLCVNGFPNAQEKMDKIREVAGDEIEAMTPAVMLPAVLAYHNGNQWISKPVQLVGIDAITQGKVSAFSKYLQHPANRKRLSFDLRDGGYDTRDHQAGPDAHERPQMAVAGWEHRRRRARAEAFQRSIDNRKQQAARPAGTSLPNAFDQAQPAAAEPVFDRARFQNEGVVIGMAMACYPDAAGRPRFALLPGDDIRLYSANASETNPEFIKRDFTIVDFYESKMSEYDSQLVFVPLDVVQDWRGMIDPATGSRMINTIQIKLKPDADGNEVRDKLRKVFSPYLFSVSTWQDKQGPLLSAVHMEIAMLNVLLFLIIAVAGFGILAIFLMIVVEKTRDIGILKSLGASRGGVMSIFLGYGLSLGLVGSGVGLILGLIFVRYINEIAKGLSLVTGQQIFDPQIYYFYTIPTIVEPWTIFWIVFGALAIAVLSSILPACRAAMLHPVEALRYE